MDISLFDLFSIGVGPSSSHTVGPMNAAQQFVKVLLQNQKLETVRRIQIELFGSLALTGEGHGTPPAILNGLEGRSAETVTPEEVKPRAEHIIREKKLNLMKCHEIDFNYREDLLLFQHDTLPFHTNGIRFTCYDHNAQVIAKQIFYSIGGGFILTEEETMLQTSPTEIQVPFPFENAKQLVAHCQNQGASISDIMLANEKAHRCEQEVIDRCLLIAEVMHRCVEKGCRHPGILPGGLNVKRRAPELFQKLHRNGSYNIETHQDILNCINMFAIAVNEENANGGRIVTAPTNGASGTIPAVLEYLKLCHPEKATEMDIVRFLLTAGAIGLLYKKGASLSAAEVGCQGEIGVASSMAAGALAERLGGNIHHVENAAEIAMEHHLGMTCDPVAGLVQIPCIERNAMGALKAVNAALLALAGDGQHHISLDKVIATMRQTGHDMNVIYKETSLGGLAVNVPEC